MEGLKLPSLPNSIQKGVPLKNIMGAETINCIGHNINFVYDEFNKESFIEDSLSEIEPLTLIERGKKIAATLKKYLPNNYTDAINIIIKSLTPPLKSTENNGLSVFFYLPHVCFIEEYGLDKNYNNGNDPFNVSMDAQYELTQRFSSEFSIRPFIKNQQDRTFDQLYKWMSDSNPHVRRLCSEGTRPRLPWATRIPGLIKDPAPSLPILEKLKNDESMYVRRSVANHLGDIAKDNLQLVLDICEDWLKGSKSDLRWVIRHSLRHPAKKSNLKAISIREAAK